MLSLRQMRRLIRKYLSDIVEGKRSWLTKSKPSVKTRLRAAEIISPFGGVKVENLERGIDSDRIWEREMSRVQVRGFSYGWGYQQGPTIRRPVDPAPDLFVFCIRKLKRCISRLPVSEPVKDQRFQHLINTMNADTTRRAWGSKWPL